MFRPSAYNAPALGPAIIHLNSRRFNLQYELRHVGIARARRSDSHHRNLTMIKKAFFSLGLFSLALAASCAKGGNGTGPPLPTIQVAISSPSTVNPASLYPTQTVTLTATVSNSARTAVAWSVKGPGTLTPVQPATTPPTAIYVAPASAGTATVTASLPNTFGSGALTLNVIDIITNVAPTPLTVGNGLTQRFAAWAVPDDAPQTFAWTCTAGGIACASFVSDTSSLATYTANDSCTGNCVQISAVSLTEPAGCVARTCVSAKVLLAPSRMNGTYAFQFQGYDSSNNPLAVVGTFVAANGIISTGVEDLLTTSSGRYSITGGSYTPDNADPNNSNNTGTLSLTLPANVYPRTFQVVLDGNGDLQLIEADGHGTGSGLAQKSSGAELFAGVQSYAFGFTGADAVSSRVGYVGVLQMNGSGAISGGQIDVNYNGNSSNSVCSIAPCTLTGTYSADPTTANLWHVSLILPGTTPLQFDLFLAAGQTNKTNPVSFYAISNPADSAHPAVSGMMTLQDSTLTYNNAAFNGSSVSALTGKNGTNSNVALTLGTSDGNGNFSGQFDQNNAGTVLSSVQFPPPGASYTYAASGTSGRYTFQMLGNPSVTPVVAPLPFVLYAAGANRGFLLDQSSSSVMTGAMYPQGNGNGLLAPSEMPGTYAAATTISGSPAVTPIAANLLLTSSGGGVFNFAETTHPAGSPQTATGTYSVLDFGVGNIALPTPPTQTFVFYVVDTAGCTGQGNNCSIQDFFMMDVDSGTPNASIIFAKQ